MRRSQHQHKKEGPRRSKTQKEPDPCASPRFFPGVRSKPACCQHQAEQIGGLKARAAAFEDDVRQANIAYTNEYGGYNEPARDRRRKSGQRDDGFTRERRLFCKFFPALKTESGLALLGFGAAIGTEHYSPLIS